MTDEYALEARSLTRAFGDFLAVNGVSLSAPRGSIYGFLGPNGAGKTTTIRMLLGLIKPKSGDIKLNGYDLFQDRRKALSGVGAIVETPSLHPNLTGLETLELACRLTDAPKSEIGRVLETVKLNSAAGKLVKNYSLGMRQRLALARALLGKPKLLLLDEPTNGLDPSGISDMRDLIRRLPDEFGATVILSSHILSEVEQIADHCSLINQGEILFEGKLKTLLEKSEPVLVVGAAYAKKAAVYLETRGLAAEIKEQRIIARGVHTKADGADILTGLIHDGQAIDHFELKRPTLEELFLQMTGPAAQ